MVSYGAAESLSTVGIKPFAPRSTDHWSPGHPGDGLTRAGPLMQPVRLGSCPEAARQVQRNRKFVNRLDNHGERTRHVGYECVQPSISVVLVHVGQSTERRETNAVPELQSISSKNVVSFCA